jgi:hypothetical protein
MGGRGWVGVGMSVWVGVGVGEGSPWVSRWVSGRRKGGEGRGDLLGWDQSGRGCPWAGVGVHACPPGVLRGFLGSSVVAGVVRGSDAAMEGLRVLC